MTRAIAIVILGLFSWAAAEPYYYTGTAPYYASGYAAALTAAPVATSAAVATIPTAPVSAAYSVQEVPLVNPPSAPIVYGGPYNSAVQWAYASDYLYPFFRR